MAAKVVTARAYTSAANLGHGLDFLGLALDVAFDEITAELADAADATGDGVVEIVGDPRHPDIPTDPQANTAGQAVMALLDARGARAGLRLHLRKGVRPGSGLGSSAASAAAAVVAVNGLLGLGLSRKELVPFAAAGEAAASGAVHADNAAPALLGGFVIVDGHGAQMVDTVGRPRFVVALPEVCVRTKVARAALPRTISMHEYSHGAARAALAVSAWQRGDIVAFGRAIEGSLVDACRAKLFPGFDQVAAAARHAGAVGVAISGAGPAVLAVLGDIQDGPRVGEAMRAGFASAGVACETFEAGVGPGAEVVP
jgi:homoserine kinase